jgi:beta-galactosidase/beta-glucuronidase
VIASATVVNAGNAAATAKLSFSLFDTHGKAVGAPVSASVALAAASNTSRPTTATSADVSIPVSSPELWSVARPYLYMLRVSTGACVALPGALLLLL